MAEPRATITKIESALRTLQVELELDMDDAATDKRDDALFDQESAHFVLGIAIERLLTETFEGSELARLREAMRQRGEA